mmetsp:Transcript_16728/g.14645  ORF Transcript_16728/g.14645 Transcript_16728/m.14645 type:complete len:222 (+) Transcript_16728:48-713(+)
MESGGSTEVVLFSYWRSSCTYRVRCALNLKGIQYEYKAVNLVKDGGEQKSEDFLKKNPQGFVPALFIDGYTLCESLPILEYIEENHAGDAQLYPTDPFLKFRCRQICEIINSGIQPLQNLSVLKKIKADFDNDPTEWSKFFITKGLKSVEAVLVDTKGKYCIGDEVTAADCFLAPQVYNALRFEIDMTQFPLISEVLKNLEEVQAFKDAHPSVQPDAPKES